MDIALVVFAVVQVAKRTNSAWLKWQYKKLGVDAIPSKQFMAAQEDGPYWRQANRIDADTDAHADAATTSSRGKQAPQLPPRDYTHSGHGTSGYNRSDGDDSWGEDSGSEAVPQLPPRTTTEF